jgi:hypothetical protein
MWRVEYQTASGQWYEYHCEPSEYAAEMTAWLLNRRIKQPTRIIRIPAQEIES